MKSLIGIVNCRSRQSTWANAIRETWMKQIPSDKADLKFFVGRGEGEVPSDTVVLDCPDDYQSLPSKIRCMAKYTYDLGTYDYLMKLDDDVVVRPNDLLASGYDTYPYSGRANRRPTERKPYWVPMGFAYWMSRECMKIVSESELPNNNDDERWVAENLHSHGINLTAEGRYHLYQGGLKDVKPKIHRPLRIQRINQQREMMKHGFAWCMFFESGHNPPRIPLEKKLTEFHTVFQEYGEPRKQQ